MISPVIEYACIIWGIGNKTKTNRIIKTCRTNCVAGLIFLFRDYDWSWQCRCCRGANNCTVVLTANASVPLSDVYIYTRELWLFFVKWTCESWICPLLPRLPYKSLGPNIGCSSIVWKRKGNGMAMFLGSYNIYHVMSRTCRHCLCPDVVTHEVAI